MDDESVEWNDLDDLLTDDDRDSGSDAVVEEEDAEYKKKTINKPLSDNNCCKKKCLSNFNDVFKLQLKSDMSQLDRSALCVYLFAMISVNEEKKRCGKVVKSVKSFQYSVKEYGVSRSVCKSAFIVLHNTTLSLVRTLCLKMAANQLIPMDNRGRHEKQQTIPENIKNLIKIHFFDTLQSPTIFKCSKKNHGTPNINQLWLSFKEKYGHHLARSTYRKHILSLLTPEILQQFMCANEAKSILNQIKLYDKKRLKNKKC